MNIIYVLLNEKDKTQSPKTYQEIKEQEFKELNAKGWGVYFSANLFSHGRRVKENCQQLLYVFADLDIAKEGDGSTQEERNAKKKEVISEIYAKLVPTLIIDTKNGIQPLWQLTDGTPDKKEEYENIIKGIIEWSKTIGCAGDAVQDCARILRMPGYYHQKGEPYFCEAIYDTKLVYKLEDVRAVFYKDEKKYETPKQDFPLNDVARAVDEINFQELIIRAFSSVGRPASFDNSGRLILDGRLTGTFQGRKDDRGYLASGSHEPFRGNRTTAVADILGVTYKEAFKWIIKEYNLNFADLEKKQRVEKQLESVTEDEFVLSLGRKEKRYTWGTNKLDRSIVILKKGNLVVLAAKRSMGKTTFSFDMAMKNAKLGHKVLYVSLEMEKNDIIEALARSYAGVTVQEEYDYEVPQNKLAKMKRKIDEILAVENLRFEGIRRGDEVIWDTVKSLMDKHPSDLIFIDNLDLINSDQKEDEFVKQKRIMKNLMSYTSDKKVPIVLIHHYRKGQKGKSNASGMDELAGSGKIADSADILINLSRRTIEEIITENIQFPESRNTTVWVQKGRGYTDRMENIFFINGTFKDFDEITEEETHQGQLANLYLKNNK